MIKIYEISQADDQKLELAKQKLKPISDYINNNNLYFNAGITSGHIGTRNGAFIVLCAEVKNPTHSNPQIANKKIKDVISDAYKFQKKRWEEYAELKKTYHEYRKKYGPPNWFPEKPIPPLLEYIKIITIAHFDYNNDGGVDNIKSYGVEKAIMAIKEISCALNKKHNNNSKRLNKIGEMLYLPGQFTLNKELNVKNAKNKIDPKKINNHLNSVLNDKAINEFFYDGIYETFFKPAFGHDPKKLKQMVDAYKPLFEKEKNFHKLFLK